MSAPKSVVKIKQKSGSVEVEYTSMIDAANYYLFELSRAALRDVGKFVAKKFKEEFYNNFNKITGNAGRATRYNVISSKDTKYPRVQIGLSNKGTEGFYAYFQEFGTSKQKKLGLLTKVASENVAEIVRIESQYLSGLSDEASSLEAKVNEEVYDGDADE